MKAAESLSRHTKPLQGDSAEKEIGYNIDVKNQDFETNKFNEYQGNFRIGCLNIEDLNFAIACDETFSWDLKKNLFITCIDQVSKDCIPVINKGSIENIPYTDIPNYLNCQFESCKYSFSNCTEDLA